MNVLMLKLLASTILLSLSLFLTLSFFFTSHSHTFHLHHLISLPSLSLDLDFFSQETIRFLCICFFNKQFFFFNIGLIEVNEFHRLVSFLFQKCNLKNDIYFWRIIFWFEFFSWETNSFVSIYIYFIFSKFSFFFKLRNKKII